MFPFHYTQKKNNTLYQYITSLNPIVYFPLNELSGVTAINYGTLGSAANGTYSGATLNQIAAPGGTTAPLFDGVSDFVNIYSAALNGAFGWSEGTIVIWIKAYNAEVWSSVTARWEINIRDDSIPKHIYQTYHWTAGYQGYDITINDVQTAKTKSTTDTNWVMLTLTWSLSNDRVRAYWNGVQEGTDVENTATPSAPVLSSNTCVIGAQNTGGTYSWYGYLAHAAVYDKELTGDEIANMYNIGKS